MDNLVKVDGERITVSGRLLHEKLGVETPYDKWFPRMAEYGFVEEADFSTFLSESTGGRPATNHALTLDMAKEIAMIQRTPQGKAVRQYFIEVEKNWNKPEVVMARAMKMMDGTIKAITAQNEKLAAEIEDMKPKAAFADAITATDDCILIREMAKILTQNGYNIGQNNLYAALVKRGLLFRKQGAHREEMYEPTQYAMGMGIFRITERRVVNGGKPFISQTVKVTTKGQKYLLGKFGNIQTTISGLFV